MVGKHHKKYKSALVEYVKKNLNKGFSEDMIRSKLTKSKVNDKLIDNIFQEVKRDKKILRKVMLYFFVIFLILFLFFAFLYIQDRNKESIIQYNYNSIVLPEKNSCKISEGTVAPMENYRCYFFKYYNNTDYYSCFLYNINSVTDIFGNFMKDGEVIITIDNENVKFLSQYEMDKFYEKKKPGQVSVIRTKESKYYFKYVYTENNTTRLPLQYGPLFCRNARSNTYNKTNN